jgi:hypothetical protein
MSSLLALTDAELDTLNDADHVRKIWNILDRDVATPQFHWSLLPDSLALRQLRKGGLAIRMLFALSIT